MFLFASVAKVTPLKEVGVNRNIMTHLGVKNCYESSYKNLL